MKITDKIILLTVFLLGMLAINTTVGLKQLDRMHAEFTVVANEDVGFMESLTAINEHQLEKSILLEKLISVAEELGFEQVPFARVEYLHDQIKNLKGGFEYYAQLSAVEISKAKAVAALSKKWKPSRSILDNIETAQKGYDASMSQMVSSVIAGGFKLSIEDLYKFKSKQDALAGDLKVLLNQVRLAVHGSLDKSRQWQQSAARILLFTLVLSLLLSLIPAFWIIRRLSGSLKTLTDTTHEIGRGNFVVDLNMSDKDEMSEVAHALNVMSQKLQSFTSQLESRNNDLTKLNKELDAFVHTVSHDIVEPLTGIIAYTAYLEKNYSEHLDQKGKDTLLGLRKSSTRLNNLLKDLLDLTRVTRIKNPYSEVNLKEVVDQAILDCNYSITISHAAVIVGPLPILTCDRIKMGHIFVNLIANAVKFSRNNPHPRVEIGYLFQGPVYEFFVRDNGIGIAPEHHKGIFELFKRVQGSEYEGSGAGLAIVKAAVESQGGEVRVKSIVGQGATFIFTIPANLSQSPA